MGEYEKYIEEKGRERVGKLYLVYCALVPCTYASICLKLLASEQRVLHFFLQFYFYSIFSYFSFLFSVFQRPSIALRIKSLILMFLKNISYSNDCKLSSGKTQLNSILNYIFIYFLLIFFGSKNF